jgi:hypothetical protein
MVAVVVTALAADVARAVVAAVDPFTASIMAFMETTALSFMVAAEETVIEAAVVTIVVAVIASVVVID